MKAYKVTCTHIETEFEYHGYLRANSERGVRMLLTGAMDAGDHLVLHSIKSTGEYKEDDDSLVVPNEILRNSVIKVTYYG